MRDLEKYALATEEFHYVEIAGCYQLVADFWIQTKLRPAEDIFYERIHLLKDGRLFIFSGYCWDGVSGPVMDRKSNMRGGLSHDGLYQLMRMGLLPWFNWKRADKEYASILRADGAWPWVIKIDLMGLKIAKGKAAHPKSRRKVKVLP